MYGTVAHFRLKPGQEQQLREFEKEIQAARLPGLVAEFTFRMDDDPNAYFQAVVFESRDSYRANADSPEQNERYEKLLGLLEGPPDWHDGEVVSSARR
jgi:heme-degrading monooxygenase HmoA